MANATQYLKESKRNGAILWEGPVCDACLALHLSTFPEMEDGETRAVRPLAMARPVECMFCDDDSNETAAVTL